jgi:hypothetical protein
VYVVRDLRQAILIQGRVGASGLILSRVSLWSKVGSTKPVMLAVRDSNLGWIDLEKFLNNGINGRLVASSVVVDSSHASVTEREEAKSLLKKIADNKFVQMALGWWLSGLAKHSRSDNQ